MEERYEAQEYDDLQKAIERFMWEDDDGEYAIMVSTLYQILDHFVPQWRKRTDRYYKLKKFVTEQQLDTNLSKIRNYIDVNVEMLRTEIVKIKEMKDEYKASLAELNRIKDDEFMALEKLRSELRKQIYQSRHKEY